MGFASAENFKLLLVGKLGKVQGPEDQRVDVHQRWPSEVSVGKIIHPSGQIPLDQ